MTAERAAQGREPEQVYRIVILVLVATLVVAGCVVIWLVSEKNKANDEVADQAAEIDSYAAGPEARDAAEAMLLEMLSFDYKDLDDEYVWLDNFSSDELRARFADQVPKLKKVIRKSKASAEGEVVQSAYSTLDSESATVLAFVRQKLKDANNRKGAIEDQWTTLTMVRDGDDWLIDDIDIVTVPPPP
jgi:Mce-associated membrane protein